MPSESDILAILSEAEQNLEELRKFSETPIPRTLAEAFEKGIDVAIEAVEGGVLISYLPEQRLIDRTRVIRLDTALELLEQFEDEYLRATVEGTLRALWGYFTFWPQLILDFGLAVWAGIKALEVEAIRRAIVLLWRRILKEWLNVIAISEIQKPLAEILIMRRKFDNLARAKALKQRKVKRVWRRKRTRR